MRGFQLILLGAFVFLFIFAILVFAGVIKVGSSGTDNAQGNVVIWGSVPQQTLQSFIDNFNRGKDYQISYVQVAEENFNETFIEALASGVGPDLVLMKGDNFLRHKDKLFVIPFQSYPERLFRDTYIDGASVFLGSDGIAGLPVTVDPVVMYYNKDLMAKNGIITPPTTWKDINKFLPLFVVKTSAQQINQTALPMGEFSNLLYFKEILSTLFLQTGNKIVDEDNLTKKYTAMLDRTIQGGTNTADALNYFVSFSNPANEFYSWNKSLPDSLSMFVSGKAGFYIGKASDLFRIQSLNPNLNFDVTSVPQPEGAIRPVVYGDFEAVSVVKSSKNFNTAYNAALALSGADFSDYLSKQLSIPPARRDLLVLKPANPYVNIFFSVALSAFSWPDPDSIKTTEIFRDMIRNVSSGRLSPLESIYDTNRKIQSLIR